MTGSDDEREETPRVVNTLAVKLAEFWTDRPSMWFKQAEATFRRARVTQSYTKYDYTVMKLPRVVLDSVADIINRVDENTADAYEQLQERLCGDFGLSKWQMVARIVEHPGLGDNRPSALMNELLALLPVEEKPGPLFLYHFLRHLPPDMKSILVHSGKKEPRELSEAADLLWDARGSSAGAVNAVAARGSSPSPSRRRAPGGRDRRRRSGTPGGLCFYHGRFGDKAHQCQAPCSWSGNAPAAGGN